MPIAPLGLFPPASIESRKIHGLLYGPTEGKYSLANHTVICVKGRAYINQAPCHTLVGMKHVIPFVSILRVPGGPNTVFRRIVSVVVSSLDRMFVAWSAPHIRYKLTKSAATNFLWKPSKADLNAPASVVFMSFTSPEHISPNRKLRVLGHSVRRAMTSFREFTAAAAVMFYRLHPSNHNISAVTVKRDFSFICDRNSGSQSSVAVSGAFGVFHNQAYAINGTGSQL
jgi:hypothetical protein